ncbi:MAG TPA: ATP synthase F1 subunit gamma, partial [Flavobacteriales bacterium]|nr:ATP synthase F1 subunit gamma [Flavobacteriales bacterium]
ALVVAITSNRGLCGGFNNNSMKIAKTAIAKHQENGSEVFVLPLGKKAFESFEREGYSFAEGFGDAALTVFDNLDFDTVSEIAQTIMNGFVTKQWDSVELSYSQFKNAAVQIPTHEPYLPLLPVSDETTSTDYILEPSREEIVENILPNALKVQLYKALLDSNAAEHGARMTAMHSATENAGDLLQELKISYNKARQASITTEILEIVAGSEALGA